MVLIDCSFTMGGIDRYGRQKGDPTKLPTAKKAAIILLDSLNFAYDRAGVIRVGDVAELVPGLTSDKAACTKGLKSLSASGGSSLFRAINCAVRLLVEPKWYLGLDCGGIEIPDLWMFELHFMAVRCSECGRLFKRDSR